ncbi:hypothetical protein MRX96_055781 [Rhipicephalus microplus]
MGLSELNVTSRYLGDQRTLYKIHTGAKFEIFENWAQELFKAVSLRILKHAKDCPATSPLLVTSIPDDIQSVLPEIESNPYTFATQLFTAYGLFNWNNINFFAMNKFKIHSTTELFTWMSFQSFGKKYAPVPRRMYKEIAFPDPRRSVRAFYCAGQEQSLLHEI